jgi:DNA adenine methylase
MVQQKLKRPALRYHGGKWKLAPWIISNFPPHRVYVEPYAGAASVLLRKPRSYGEVYNDRDDEIVNVFRVLRDPVQACKLRELIRFTPFARVEFEKSYRRTRNPIEQARRTIIRSFMGFGSAACNTAHTTGFRANSNRSGTVPAHDFAHYPDLIEAFTERLRWVVIENKEACAVIAQHDSPQTLHYIDPPYVRDTRNAHRDCYRFEMNDAAHAELASVLSAVRGMVVLSGYDCPLYRDLYPTWQRVSISAHADGAADRTEWLWLNDAATRNTEGLLAGCR